MRQCMALGRVWREGDGGKCLFKFKIKILSLEIFLNTLKVKMTMSYRWSFTQLVLSDHSLKINNN